MKALLMTVLLAFFGGPAFAATCAHIETGQALDPQSCSTTADYLKRYTQEVTAGWAAVIVPDGTQHNAVAVHNKDGSWSTTNPTPPSPPVIIPATAMTVTAFKKRFSLAERATIEGSSDVTVKVFWDELNTAITVDLNDPDTNSGVNYLASIGLLTVPRAVEILTP